ncbi:MAG: choice-of-anchor Q domain-containing protein, partial [Thermonemataceae bacterium]
LVLADNGGNVQTRALPPNSPAINLGSASLAPTTDQRGVERDTQPDLGAYEFVP